MKNNARRNSFVNIENLAILTDEELRRTFLSVRSELNKKRRKKINTRNLEIEYCYIQKEMQDRKESYRKTRAK